MRLIKALNFPGLKNFNRMSMRSSKIIRITRLPRKKNKPEKGCIDAELFIDGDGDITLYPQKDNLVS